MNTMFKTSEEKFVFFKKSLIAPYCYGFPCFLPRRPWNWRARPVCPLTLPNLQSRAGLLLKWHLGSFLDGKIRCTGGFCRFLGCFVGMSGCFVGFLACLVGMLGCFLEFLACLVGMLDCFAGLLGCFCGVFYVLFFFVCVGFSCNVFLCRVFVCYIGFYCSRISWALYWG